MIPIKTIQLKTIFYAQRLQQYTAYNALQTHRFEKTSTTLAAPDFIFPDTQIVDLY